MPETDESGLDDVMAALRDGASGVHGSFDAGALAAAGRRRAQRRRLTLGGALAGAVVMVLGGGVWGLATLADRQPAQTVVGDSTSSPTPTDEILPVQVLVDTSGWPTYSSPEYPVTFQYPPAWTVGDLGGEPAGSLDGCDSISCVLFVSPPASTSTASIELIRNGFPGSFAAGYAVQLPTEIEVLGSLPGLTGWALDRPNGDGPGPIVVVRSEDEWGSVDYSLTVAGSTASGLALGDQNPRPAHPEAAFSFSTNIGNIGGQTGGEHTETLVAILASVQPNPGFAPTQPADDGTGRPFVSVYDDMSTPTLGALTPDRSWRTYTSETGNVTVRYPPTWTVDDSTDGIVWIVAPSGYVIDLLTNQSGGRWCDKDRGPSEVLGTVDQAQTQSKGGTGPAEVRWTNGGELPVWIGLTRPDGPGCYVTGLGFGGTSDVYLGSADNWGDPEPEELDQATAILASARRAG